METQAPHLALQQALQKAVGEPLLILLSGHPDPDAIGSALAHQRICRSLGVPATIAHVRPVSHRENRALVKLLGVEMRQVSSAKDLAPYKFLSLVDTCSTETCLEIPETLQLLTVVDHHLMGEKPTAAFVDVRRAYGASSSIYAEYLRDGLVPLTGQGRDDSVVATALFFGIQTDTNDFSLASAADFAATAYLRTYCDAEVLKQVGSQTVSAAAMDVVGRALTSLIVVRGVAVAGVGHVPLADRDSIGTAADYILRREDIDTVLVYGIVGDQVDGSLRTNSASVDPEVFMFSAFGADSTGRPYGGGRADKGGFQIPLGIFADCPDQELAWHLVEQSIRTRLGRVIHDLPKAQIRRPSGAGASAGS